MEHQKWTLQLFAEGVTGDTGAADAGQGIAGKDPARAENTQVAAAEHTRLTWAQIMADPEYNRQMQATIRARLKAAEASWQKKNAGRGLAPAAQHTPAMTAGASPRPTGPVEGRGPSGRPVPTGPEEGRGRLPRRGEAPPRNDRIIGSEVALRQHYDGFVQQRAFTGRPSSDLADARPPSPRGRLGEAQLRQHYDGLVQQGERLKQVFPGFDLQRELRDPAFTRLTAPHVGVSVADAYYLLHRQEHQGAAMRLAAKKTAEKLSAAIRSGSHRPAENGTGSQAPVVTGFNYANASLQQREALKNAIRRAGSRGEKLYPTGREF